MKDTFLISKFFSIPQWSMFFLSLSALVALVTWQELWYKYVIIFTVLLAFTTFIAYFLSKAVEVRREGKKLSRITLLFGFKLIERHEISISSIDRIFIKRTSYYQVTGRHPAHSSTGYIKEFDAFLRLNDDTSYYLGTSKNLQRMRMQTQALSKKLGIELVDYT